MKNYIRKIVRRLLGEDEETKDLVRQILKQVLFDDTIRNPWIQTLSEEYLVPGLKTILNEYDTDIKGVLNTVSNCWREIEKMKHEIYRNEPRLRELEQVIRGEVGKEVLKRMGFVG